MARVHDPFSEMERMLGTFAGPMRAGMMPMDAYEKDGTYTLRFDLAGADPEHIDVTVDAGMLTVTADSPAEDTDGANWLIRERPTGTHSRQVRLGDRLDPDRVEASYDHGVLTVKIPMRPEEQPHKVSITSGGSRPSGEKADG